MRTQFYILPEKKGSKNKYEGSKKIFGLYNTSYSLHRGFSSGLSMPLCSSGFFKAGVSSFSVQSCEDGLRGTS